MKSIGFRMGRKATSNHESMSKLLRMQAVELYYRLYGDKSFTERATQ